MEWMMCSFTLMAHVSQLALTIAQLRFGTFVARNWSSITTPITHQLSQSHSTLMVATCFPAPLIVQWRYGIYVRATSCTLFTAMKALPMLFSSRPQVTISWVVVTTLLWWSGSHILTNLSKKWSMISAVEPQLCALPLRHLKPRQPWNLFHARVAPQQTCIKMELIGAQVKWKRK